MPEVVRGSRPSLDAGQRSIGFDTAATDLHGEASRQSRSSIDSHGRPRKSVDFKGLERRRTDRPEERPPAEAYYDSRAATKREFKRRGSTLADYYRQNPTLLPQLPFTWHHGWRRVKLGLLITLMFIDACVIPLVLYYTMTFAGNVEGWIVFAVVATIWGGPTYLEFAVRSWRLIKKEDFYRPLGTKNRWSFDFVHWLSVFTIGSVTAFLIVGRVLYIIEDVVAVNANAGRPYREAVHARYNASPRFRQMVMNQSLFWGVPSVLIGLALIVVVCVHEVDKNIAYGLGWGIPFFWALIWTFLSVIWVKRDMRKERITWEEDNEVEPHGAKMLALEDTHSTPEQASENRGPSNPATPQVDVPSPSRDHDGGTQTDAEIKKDAEQPQSSSDGATAAEPESSSEEDKHVDGEGKAG
ncbi:hypothetical protein DV737_g4969, partial [Chaetothyriales sp. CBS 132003]